jgi:hypothetical protein
MGATSRMHTHSHQMCKEQIQPTRPVKLDELPTETFYNRMVRY